MNDRSIGWFCCLIIILLIGDLSYRVWSDATNQSDPMVIRLRSFNKAVSAFDDAAFGSQGMNSPPIWESLNGDTNKMEFIKYRADTILAFAMAYKKTLFETNGVERSKDTVVMMQEVARIRDEIKSLRFASATQGLPVIGSGTDSWSWVQSQTGIVTKVSGTENTK